MKILSAIAVAGALILSAPFAFAQEMGMSHGAMMPASSQGMSDLMSDGTVKKLDSGAGTVTLAHGPMENLGMPGMTMSFPVQDKAMLEGLSVGAKVKFHAEQMGEVITITKIEPVN
ncbi:MAG: copper-binding protein [Gammaproteobacteria bacterium]|nr:copper-binding protein [Gammaproteobacteria bacterium]MBU1655497.1 copper-binding protein [Gammaproteobacteria bacterium]MBU1960828.1 copper-binding protein [Gammaproteobacteria bacterium]